MNTLAEKAREPRLEAEAPEAVALELAACNAELDVSLEAERAAHAALREASVRVRAARVAQAAAQAAAFEADRVRAAELHLGLTQLPG